MVSTTTKRLKPIYNAGDYCRIFRESPNGNPKTECKIVSIEGEVRIASLQITAGKLIGAFSLQCANVLSIGYETEFKIPCKELLPSSGKSFREDQEFAAYLDNPIEQWKVGKHPVAIHKLVTHLKSILDSQILKVITAAVDGRKMETETPIIRCRLTFYIIFPSFQRLN